LRHEALNWLDRRYIGAKNTVPEKLAGRNKQACALACSATATALIAQKGAERVTGSRARLPSK